MAFNPFHGFRKYRKSMFAVLAIVCMFTFVLSSGMGGKNDILNRLTDWFPGNTRKEDAKNPKVAEIDGKTIEASAISETRLRRKMADVYMSNMVRTAHAQLRERAQTKVKGDPALLIRVPMIVEEKALAAQYHTTAFYGMQNAQRGMPPVPPEKTLQDYIGYLDQQIARLKADGKTDEMEFLESLKRLLEQDRGRLRAIPMSSSFFGGSVQSGDDVLDFLVWKWEADRRKIVLTWDTVLKLRDQDLLGEDLGTTSTKLLEEMGTKVFPGFTTELFKEALTDEYRVQIAQAQVLGDSAGLVADPVVITPYEYKKHYSDECKSVRIAMLPVDAEPFLAKVTDTPSEKELKALYDKHKKDLYEPNLDRPGFMDPKRVKLEYLAVKVDSPYFRKLGQETAAKNALLIAGAAQAVSVFTDILPAAAWLGELGARKFDEIPESRVQRDYEKYKLNERFNEVNKNWPYSALVFFQPVHDTSLVRPENFALTVADALAAKATGAPIFSPGVTLNVQAKLQELRDRTAFGMQLLSNVGPNANAIWGINDALNPPPLSINIMRSKFLEDMAVEQAKKTVLAEFNKFQEDVKKKAKDIKKPDTKAELQKMAEEFAKKHNLTFGKSTELHDKYSLLADPGLKVLKDRYYKDNANPRDKLGAGAAGPYFDEGGMTRFGPREGTGLYSPLWFEGRSPELYSIDLNETFYLTWKTEETDAKVRPWEVSPDAKPEAKKEVEKLRAEVLAAWKLGKARELAEAAAKEIQKKITEKSIKDLATLTDFAAENHAALIELDPMAKFKMEPSPFPGTPAQYRPPSIPVEKVEYQTPELRTKLLDMRNKPKGETVIVHDGPKSRYYVGVLLDVTDVTDAEFQAAFTKVSPRDQILEGYEMTRRVEYRKAIAARLRAEAKVTTMPDELKKTSDRAGSGGFPGIPDSDE